MFKFLLINFLIACIGFGSGSVFLSFIYDAYINYTGVSIQTLDIATSISLVLPAPISPKMIGLIAYQEYGFTFVWPAIIAFVIPTICISLYSFKHYNKFKNNLFFKKMAKYFPPLLASITVYIIIVLCINNTTTPKQVTLFIIPLATTLILRYKANVRNNGLLIIVNSSILMILLLLK